MYGSHEINLDFQFHIEECNKIIFNNESKKTGLKKKFIL
jgi:hypothetical protein